MKIRPVKSYKKPAYAVSLAAIAALGTLSGCYNPFQTEGVAPMPSAEEILENSEKAMAVYYKEMENKDSYIAAFEKLGCVLSERTEPLPISGFGGNYGGVPFENADSLLFVGFYTGGFSTHLSNSKSAKETNYGYFLLTEINGAVHSIALINLDKNPYEKIDTIAEKIMADFSEHSEKAKLSEDVFETAGIVAVEGDSLSPVTTTATVLPEGTVVMAEEEDTPDDSDDIFMLEGDVAYVGDEYDEPLYEADAAPAFELSLAGDIAFPPDYAAADEGMAYSEEYISAFKEAGIELTEKEGNEWGSFALDTGGAPFIISLEAKNKPLFISFCDLSDEDVCNHIENIGGERFGYGYTAVISYLNSKYRLLIIDAGSDHYEDVNGIAEYILGKGF